MNRMIGGKINHILVNDKDYIMSNYKALSDDSDMAMERIEIRTNKDSYFFELEFVGFTVYMPYSLTGDVEYVTGGEILDVKVKWIKSIIHNRRLREVEIITNQGSIFICIDLVCEGEHKQISLAPEKDIFKVLSEIDEKDIISLF